MKTRVTFRQGRPAADMTRDEAVTWLLGCTEGAGLVPAWAACWTVTSMVDSMKEGHLVRVEVPQGDYALTVTVSGRWYRRVRTYHAEET